MAKTVGVLLVLWAIGWLLVPPLLKAQLESRLQTTLGRVVTLGEVDFKPWSLELALHDLSIARAPGVAGTGPQLSIKRIYIDASLRSLWQWAPVVDALVVDAPHLRLTHQGAGHFDVDDVLARLAAEPSDPKASPLRFALYNLVLTQGALTFEDAALGKTHQLAKVQLSLPFLSNLDANREVLVQPLLAFDVNGKHFDTSAHTTPFAQTRKTEAHLVFQQLDLAPYLDYLPASLPVRLASAALSADLKLSFEQLPHTAVTLSGTVAAHQVKLQTPDGKGGAAKSGTGAPESSDLLQFGQLKVQLKAVRPLVQDLQFGRIELSQPQLTLTRDKAGVLNWLALFTPASTPHNTIKSRAATASDERAGGQKGQNPEKNQEPTPWTLGVDEVKLTDGGILWSDHTTSQPTQLTLGALELKASALTWPVKQAVPLEGSAQLAGASLHVKGETTDRLATLSAQLADLPLNLAAPYLAQLITPTLNGLAKAELALRWQAAEAKGQAQEIQLQVPSLTLDKVVLADHRKAPLASFKQFQLVNGVIDLGRQSATLGQVRLIQPKASVARASDGRWMFQEWLKPQPTSAVLAASAPPSSEVTQAKPWSLVVQEAQLSEGAASFEDKFTAKPVQLELSGLSLQVKNFSTVGTQPFGLNLAARLRHGHTEPGSLSWRGTGGLSPLSVQGDLTIERLPVHALEPYVSDSLNVALQRLDASFKGRIDLAQRNEGLALKLRGDTRLDDLQVQTLAQEEPFKPAEDLLSWKSLNLSGLDVSLAPGAPTRVDVAGVVLSDFYARLILNEAGQLNLQNTVKTDTPTPSTSPVAPAATDNTDPGRVVATSANTIESIASSASSTRATGTNDAKKAMQPLIHVGPVSLIGGRVDFTDRFIKPNYSAALTELTGKLGAFASQTPAGEVQLADLDLRGRVEGSATLEVLGKVNPLAKPLALDIKGRVRDLELPPLSPYAVRYAGYGIERGKLSVDVAYLVQPDGMLTASNQLTLNQLKFGDKVPDAPASLPVKLAVALLADRNGVIDLNLPVSGSLNDPQFRLMPIVFKILGNLIVKAITAPFSLLAHALGGDGEALSAVSFEPGSAQLSAAAKAGLDKVAKALQDRPALKMTVLGTASLEVEREAFKRAQLQALLQAEQRRSAPAAEVPSKEATTALSAESLAAVSAQAYPALLKAVYKRGDFPKPRNLLGLTKDIPVPEMEALLLANLTATESDLQALAVKRGVAVRDYLGSLKLPMDRLFLGAAKAVPPDAKWAPRAELNLTMD